MALTINEVFRDFATDGVPSSGAWRPKKSEIRAALNAIIAGTGGGLYDFIPASNTGAGTPNAIRAITSVDMPVAPLAALLAVNVYEENTSSPVTVAFNDGVPLTIKTDAGFDIAAGSLQPGRILAGYVSGSTFRLLTDNISSTIVAAMEDQVSLATDQAAISTAAAATATSQAGIAAAHASDAASSASDAQSLVEAAASGFTGFADGQAYDFGFVADETTYFNQDWGTL